MKSSQQITQFKKAQSLIFKGILTKLLLQYFKALVHLLLCTLYIHKIELLPHEPCKYHPVNGLQVPRELLTSTLPQAQQSYLPSSSKAPEGNPIPRSTTQNKRRSKERRDTRAISPLQRTPRRIPSDRIDQAPARG